MREWRGERGVERWEGERDEKRGRREEKRSREEEMG